MGFVINYIKMCQDLNLEFFIKTLKFNLLIEAYLAVEIIEHGQTLAYRTSLGPSFQL